MNRWLYLLLLAAPAAVLAEALHAPPLTSFVLAALGLVPLAGLIGIATEALAERLGHRIGGLLNATFGNAAEIIIGLTALAAGLPEVVRASLAGSIIGNVLLVLGSAMLAGGWRVSTRQCSPWSSSAWRSLRCSRPLARAHARAMLSYRATSCTSSASSSPLSCLCATWATSPTRSSAYAHPAQPLAHLLEWSKRRNIPRLHWKRRIPLSIRRHVQVF